MKLENMNRDFPKMPEEMRQMIEQEVEKQLAKPDMLPGNRKTGRHISKKRLAIAVAAATCPIKRIPCPPKPAKSICTLIL